MFADEIGDVLLVVGGIRLGGGRPWSACTTPHPTPPQISYEKAFKLKLSGNEVYYTARSLLLILKHSCSKFHCQKGFNLIVCSYKIVGGLRLGGGRPWSACTTPHPTPPQIPYRNT